MKVLEKKGHKNGFLSNLGLGLMIRRIEFNASSKPWKHVKPEILGIADLFKVHSFKAHLTINGSNGLLQSVWGKLGIEIQGIQNLDE